MGPPHRTAEEGTCLTPSTRTSSLAECAKNTSLLLTSSGSYNIKWARATRKISPQVREVSATQEGVVTVTKEGDHPPPLYPSVLSTPGDPVSQRLSAERRVKCLEGSTHLLLHLLGYLLQASFA
ncbi:unnamed protein product [Acanthoscelides obtectus]|uniref:Uncharacterized protein n=1 Tax=Acanthoscelides obtectus TaxID=200917 RepID=A0A9P0L1P1_ACAOB|nr:unnamed protein product [Acanthoscelides obtectus]CAK1637875.1 hypothetical protein AOBTE_LOCUS10254 [Acanthoscelides obtectus]